MILLDVNVLVRVHRKDFPDQVALVGWLERTLIGEQPVAIADHVWLGVYRIVTNPRIFKTPSTAREALKFLEQVLSAPAAIRVVPSVNCFERMKVWGVRDDIRGDRVPDCFLASLAVELGATLVTLDTGFSGYTGLKWRRPLDRETRTNQATRPR